VQDYFECLHHKKEIARVNFILREAKKKDDLASGVSAAAAILNMLLKDASTRSLESYEQNLAALIPNMKICMTYFFAIAGVVLQKEMPAGAGHH